MNVMKYLHHFHVYECEDCIVTFAVEMAFEDQSIVACPVCKSNEYLRDITSGAMLIKKSKDSCLEQESNN